MNILHLSTSDSFGGAARAAYRLHRGLLDVGIASTLQVQTKGTDDPSVIGPSSKRKKLFNLLRPRFDSFPVSFYKKREPLLFSPSWLPSPGLLKQIKSLKPDLLHIHWAQKAMVNPRILQSLGIPILWSMHDNWLFTGGCHIAGTCDKFTSSCGACPRLGSTRNKDLSYEGWKRKKQAYSKVKDFYPLALSSWMANQARKSSLLADRKVSVLPNPLDTSTYSPVDKPTARKLLGLSDSLPILLFGALDPDSDPNKGYHLLVEALEHLGNLEFQILIFGAGFPKKTLKIPQPVRFLGKLSDDLSLRIAYSVADCMVVPSLQEAFGQTASESLACGTPVVAFGHSGLLDIVDHQVNGYLAKPFSPEDLAQGIRWVLTHSNPESLSEASRKKALEAFSYRTVIPRYVQLYTDILSSSGAIRS